MHLKKQAPAYIGEMSPPAVRGVLVSMKEAMIVVGMLFGYTIGWVLTDTAGGWRFTYGVGAVPAVGMMVGMYFMPPSARYVPLFFFAFLFLFLELFCGWIGWR